MTNNVYIIVIYVVITVNYCKSILLYSPLNSYLYVDIKIQTNNSRGLFWITKYNVLICMLYYIGSYYSSVIFIISIIV